jgi:hypothetical protein
LDSGSNFVEIGSNFVEIGSNFVEIGSNFVETDSGFVEIGSDSVGIVVVAHSEEGSRCAGDWTDSLSAHCPDNACIVIANSAAHQWKRRQDTD